MKITNCKRCGKLFQKTTRDICVDCVKEEGQILETIRVYLRNNPSSSLAEVSHATDISMEVISDLIYVGMLRLVDFPNMAVECQGCGTPTQEGRYCSKCQEELGTKLAGAARVLKQSTKDKDVKPKGFYTR